MLSDSDTGSSLRGDFSSLLNDEAFHDVTLVCSDRVQVGASKTVLAARSNFFKTMFRNHSESREARMEIQLREIRSDVVHVTLHFIYSGDIDGVNMTPELAIETYRAAIIFLLPKLMELVANHARVSDIVFASPLLNEAVVAVSPNKFNRDLYDVLLQAFCSKPLNIGDLNNLSSKALEVMLEHSYNMAQEFQTTEYNLLLCVLEWAWSHDNGAPPATTRHSLFKKLQDAGGFYEGSDFAVNISDIGVRVSLSKILMHVKVHILCPHRLAHLIEVVDVIREVYSPQDMALWNFACVNARCPPSHPSGYRGKPHVVWDTAELGGGIVVYQGGAVAEYRTLTGNVFTSVRALQPFVLANGGIFEWDVIIESSGVFGNRSFDAVGFAGESFNKDKKLWECSPTWVLYSADWATWVTYNTTKLDRNTYGKPFGNGDVITFHVDCATRACGISINGTRYPSILTGLPDKIYPAATLHPQAR